MDSEPGIACIIYAAKSTEDKRGSIPEQLRECREAIEADPRRHVACEYEDEAFSAYRRNRGPQLRDATQHAEDLAAQRGICELWVQHSDRLARGDGRKAQHTVEVALWALKHDVRVRTLQDPETFRDLLYAVVTGQRNNEDSKRKAISSQAGRKRAIARGEFVGCLPDGYKLHRELDAAGEIRRRMVLDPQRRALLELIFRLALRGRSCGQIARSVNKAGWLTKPTKRLASPRPFDLDRVYDILKNPRYAGLSVYKGETLARRCWPAYVTERQHERICALLTQRRRGVVRRRELREPYLLVRLARCARCGSALHADSGRRREDGSRQRSYICSSHREQRGSHQCDAPPIDAHGAEAMLAASVGALLVGDSPPPSPDLPTGRVNADVAHAELRAAARAGDEPRLAQAIKVEFAHLAPHAALLGQVALSQRQARELAQAQRLTAWSEQERCGRTAQSRAQCIELNALLRGWFSEITIEVRPRSVLIAATRRPGAGPAPAQTQLHIDRAAWARASARASSQTPRYVTWEKAEVIGALQGWSDVNGRSPTPSDWRYCGPAHPCALTVRRKLGAWDQALRRASLAPAEQPVRHVPWTRAEMIAALRAWSRRHGRSPASAEWVHAAAGRPCAYTVRKEFGCWADALAAAGLEIPRPAPRQVGPWQHEQIVDAMREWTVGSGRAPAGPDWIRSAPGRPCTGTVYKHFGSWGAALGAAGL